MPDIPGGSIGTDGIGAKKLNIVAGGSRGFQATLSAWRDRRRLTKFRLNAGGGYSQEDHQGISVRVDFTKQREAVTVDKAMAYPWKP